MRAQKRVRYDLGMVLVMGLLLAACQPASFSGSSEPVVSHQGIVPPEPAPPAPAPRTASATVNTTKNQPVTFEIDTLINQKLLSLSLGVASADSLDSANGTLATVNSSGLKLTYTPRPSFVGSDQVNDLIAKDADGGEIRIALKVNVGNTVNSIQPALAVRGMSCITCHSKVSSNIIADYGFGDPWYFDANAGDSYYYDRLGAGNGLATLEILNASSIIVPKAPAPAEVRQAYGGVETLSGFVQARFAEGGHNTASQVREIDQLRINLPTPERIRQVFGNPAAAFLYLPDTQNSPALSGLNYDLTHQVFTVTNLVCDGDLYLGAPVVFDGATVSSINGCRIYATRSIFVNGQLKAAGLQSSLNFNIQLLSATSIWVGTGRTMLNGAFCETDGGGAPDGWYSSSHNTGVDCTSVANAGHSSCDSQLFRAKCALDRDTFTRSFPDATALSGLLGPQISGPSGPAGGGSVAVERAQVEASLGHPLLDASCTPGGRSAALERVLLAAPYVNNRFNGEFSGSTIAEAALMSLGTFQFQFDSVFSRTSVFSLLAHDELISGTGL